ncbi:MAG: hypothetical protein NTZ64_11205 [Polaromonas sp.]|nr:hypothetical protein [Polaromonas sp.]
MKPYRSREWKIFRNEVIRLDGGACSNCGKTASDGAILQVHHKQYFSGRSPWDYPYNLCETLCKGCHAAEHGLIPPKFGWEHVGWDDLGELNGICECCGTSIRYIFLVQHPKWNPMEVGEICCDNLTSIGLTQNSEIFHIVKSKIFKQPSEPMDFAALAACNRIACLS